MASEPPQQTREWPDMTDILTWRRKIEEETNELMSAGATEVERLRRVELAAGAGSNIKPRQHEPAGLLNETGSAP